MRWSEPDYIEKRTIKRFAIFPIRARNGEWVWLEYVTILQEYWGRTQGWISVGFIEKEETP